MKTIFETSATHTGGSKGHVASDAGTIDMQVMPASGSLENNDATSPEELLAAGYAASFAAALEATATEHGMTSTEDISVTVHIAGNEDEDGMFLEATLDVYIPDVNKETGESLVNDAHERCTFSQATQDNITVNLNLLLD
ncbi:Ohr family peroxiredoxin [Zeaxanthinibacter sp. PT1]|uniref:Ohr family peroxiredoxin n=1 Tax=Zeaxanthinibacter TaxID=561554 RepID=UPI00234A0A17|nr:Ohr family peroxiredoxin [Zeaxanthinibacter sp. PT1]MDC6352562.1 Ohr family peroxiredoxin [Zeaxanthinibacter sp. PT1]